MYSKKSAFKSVALMATLLLAASASAAPRKQKASSPDTHKKRIEERLPYYLAIGAGLVDSDIKDPSIDSTANEKSQTNPFAYSLSVGKFFHKYFRADIELNHRSRTTFRKADSTVLHFQRFFSTTGFLNAAFEYPIFSEKLNIFAIAGIGASYNKADDFFTNTYAVDVADQRTTAKNKIDFAWQAGAGLSARISEHVSFDLSSKWLDRGKTDTKNTAISFTPSDLPLPNPKSTISVNPKRIGVREVLTLFSLRINS